MIEDTVRFLETWKDLSLMSRFLSSAATLTEKSPGP